MKNQKEKLRKQSHSLLQQQQKVKYLRINLPKEAKDLDTKKQQNTDEKIKGETHKT